MSARSQKHITKDLLLVLPHLQQSHRQWSLSSSPSPGPQYQDLQQVALPSLGSPLCTYSVSWL